MSQITSYSCATLRVISIINGRHLFYCPVFARVITVISEVPGVWKHLIFIFHPYGENFFFFAIHFNGIEVVFTDYDLPSRSLSLRPFIIPRQQLCLAWTFYCPPVCRLPSPWGERFLICMCLAVTSVLFRKQGWKLCFPLQHYTNIHLYKNIVSYEYIRVQNKYVILYI